MTKVIIFPTDTVYGIGTPIFDTLGIKKIYEIKHRDYSKPLACLCYDLKQIESICYVSDLARKLINKYLPGALTIILDAKEEVVDKIGYKTIGVRIPDCQIALDILRKNGPMLTTSVNSSGEKAMNDYEQIVKCYGSLVDKIYKADGFSSSIASTVIRVIGDNIEVLREGEITEAELKNV